MATASATASMLMLKSLPPATPRRRHQHDVLLIQIGGDLFGDHLAHGAGEAASTPSTTPTGLAVMKLPPVTRMKLPAIGVLQALEAGLDLDCGSRHGRLDALERAASVTRRPPLCDSAASARGGQFALDLRTRAMHQHQAHAQARRKQVAVVGQGSGASSRQPPSPPKPSTKVSGREAWM